MNGILRSHRLGGRIVNRPCFDWAQHERFTMRLTALFWFIGSCFRLQDLPLRFTNCNIATFSHKIMSNKVHITYLDSIRGLAALTVINEHYVIAYGLPCETTFCSKILDYSPFNFWWEGGAAVSMFFVLSGLVLSLRYFRVGHQVDLAQFNLLSFTVARLARIWLPYLMVLLISAIGYSQITHAPILKTQLPPSDWITGMWHDYHLSLSDMCREAFLLILPATVVLLPQAWTLSIELVLSLLLPVGLLLAERGMIWLIFFVMFAVVLLGVSPYLMHFLFGLLIARYYSELSHYLTEHPWQRRLVLLLGIFLYTSGAILHDLKLSKAFVWLGAGLGASCILMFVIGSVKTQAMLSRSILHQIGKISYSAYLIHMLILLSLTPHILNWLELLTVDRFSLWLGGYVFTLLIVQGLSWCCYYCLEIPSISLGRRVADAIRAVNF